MEFNLFKLKYREVGSTLKASWKFFLAIKNVLFFFSILYWALTFLALHFIVESILLMDHRQYLFPAILTYISTFTLSLIVNAIINKWKQSSEKYPHHNISYKEYFSDLESAKTIRLLSTYFKFLINKDDYTLYYNYTYGNYPKEDFNSNDLEGYEIFYASIEGMLLKNGGNCTCLILDPFSDAAAQRTDDIDNKFDTKIMCCLNILRLYGVKKHIKGLSEGKSKNLAVKIYDTSPPFSFLSKDESGSVGYFPIKNNTSHADRFTYETRYSKSSEFFENIFDQLSNAKEPYLIDVEDYFFSTINIKLPDDNIDEIRVMYYHDQSSRRMHDSHKESCIYFLPLDEFSGLPKDEKINLSFLMFPNSRKPVCFDIMRLSKLKKSGIDEEILLNFQLKYGFIANNSKLSFSPLITHDFDVLYKIIVKTTDGG